MSLEALSPCIVAVPFAAVAGFGGGSGPKVPPAPWAVAAGVQSTAAAARVSAVRTARRVRGRMKDPVPVVEGEGEPGGRTVPLVRDTRAHRTRTYVRAQGCGCVCGWERGRSARVPERPAASCNGRGVGGVRAASDDVATTRGGGTAMVDMAAAHEQGHARDSNRARGRRRVRDHSARRPHRCPRTPVRGPRSEDAGSGGNPPARRPRMTNDCFLSGPRRSPCAAADPAAGPGCRSWPGVPPVAGGRAGERRRVPRRAPVPGPGSEGTGRQDGARRPGGVLPAVRRGGRTNAGPGPAGAAGSGAVGGGRPGGDVRAVAHGRPVRAGAR